MTILTVAVALGLAATCQNVVDPQTIVGIARHESGLDAAFISPPNKNGSRDYGLMQINDRNFAWLGLTAETAMDPCQSIAAAGWLLASYSRYNTGNPASGVANGYVSNVINSVRAVQASGADQVFSSPDLRSRDPPPPPAPPVLRDILHDDGKPTLPGGLIPMPATPATDQKDPTP